MILMGWELPVFGVDGDTGHSDYNFCGVAESLHANTTIVALNKKYKRKR